MRSHIWFSTAFTVFLFLGVEGDANAIEFKKRDPAHWITLDKVADGCVARLGADIHNGIYVGLCNTHGVPAGRGILFDGARQYLVKVTDGHIYSKLPYLRDPDLIRFADHADMIAALHLTHLAAHDFRSPLPMPSDSRRYQLGQAYLARYANANANDTADVKRIMTDAVQAAFSAGLNHVLAQRSSRLVVDFTRQWTGIASAEALVPLGPLGQEFASEEARDRERRERAAAERERQQELTERRIQEDRARRIPTACNGFYAGYTGHFQGRGLLATKDRYVVRYVNADRRMVTIEGNESGNSLQYCELLEIPCIDLLERTR